MPVTPFHFGAGLAAKAAAPQRFGLLAFCAANAIMDVEPLYYALTRQDPLHRFFHTLLGALIAALLTIFLFWILKTVLQWLHLSRFVVKAEISPPGVWLGAMSGAISHVLLDSVVHADVQPFAPLTRSNPFLGWFSIFEVQNFLTLLALAGIAGIILRSVLHRSKKAPFHE
jgi:membrane-bound metal-dependent hydrolase YbcI (DUF457 family)